MSLLTAMESKQCQRNAWFLVNLEVRKPIRWLGSVSDLSFVWIRVKTNIRRVQCRSPTAVSLSPLQIKETETNHLEMLKKKIRRISFRLPAAHLLRGFFPPHSCACWFEYLFIFSVTGRGYKLRNHQNQQWLKCPPPLPSTNGHR